MYKTGFITIVKSRSNSPVYLPLILRYCITIEHP